MSSRSDPPVRTLVPALTTSRRYFTDSNSLREPVDSRSSTKAPFGLVGWEDMRRETLPTDVKVPRNPVPFSVAARVCEGGVIIAAAWGTQQGKRHANLLNRSQSLSPMVQFPRSET